MRDETADELPLCCCCCCCCDVAVVFDGFVAVVGGGVEEGDFRGDNSWLIREAPAPRKEERGLLVLVLGSGVRGLLL